jgi:glycosyltransferase involved in cell wall biosynthesis
VSIERISIIAPMLNEAAHVDDFVADLAAQDFDGEVQVIVADGGSTDASVERLRDAAERAGLDIAVIDNPHRWVSPGLNLCLDHADGDLIVRLDIHSRYPSNYLSACARVSEETGAWNVGGLFTVEARTPFERAFAAALDTPFGGHNWTRKRDLRHDADTVFCGAFRPIVFERVGRYDERIAVTEVEDLNVRIRRAGGRVVYDPTITLRYLPRRSYASLFKQYYRYGLWKVPVTVKHRQPLSGRSMVPVVFVGSLVVLAVAGRRLLKLELGVYGAAALGAAVEVVARRGERWTLVPRVASLFATMHVAHGLGSLHGWLRQAKRVSLEK